MYNFWATLWVVDTMQFFSHYVGLLCVLCIPYSAIRS